jgi:outer membrane protein
MNRVYIIIIALMLLMLSGFIYLNNKSNGAAYVITAQIFQEFEMKKDLEKKYQSTHSARARITDSLEIELRKVSNDLKTSPNNESIINQYQYLQELYTKKREQFIEDDKALSEDLDTQIFKRMNEYISEYGKENNYDFIFGNAAGGSLMYGKAAKDITKDVIQFMNAKYNNKK